MLSWRALHVGAMRGSHIMHARVYPLAVATAALELSLCVPLSSNTIAETLRFTKYYVCSIIHINHVRDNWCWPDVSRNQMEV